MLLLEENLFEYAPEFILEYYILCTRISCMRNYQSIGGRTYIKKIHTADGKPVALT